MSNIIGLNTKLFGLEKNIKQSEPTRVANDLGQLGDPAEKERVLNPIVSEAYMIAHGGITPTGTIEITSNGTGIDVAQYRYADVSVSGGVELLKTVLTLINEKDTDISIPAGSFLYDYAIILSDFIDNAANRLTTHIDIDNELHVLDLSNLIPTLPANTTATYNLYYLSNDTACNPAIEFSENYGSQLSNMTFDTDAFVVDDATADSAITFTWDK